MNVYAKQIAAVAAVLVMGTVLAAQTIDGINNWPVQYSRNVAESTNVKLDENKGIETTGTPAKAVWSRQVNDAGTYLLKVKYNPMANRAMKLAFNGVPVSTKGMNASIGPDTDTNCDNAKWRSLVEVEAVAGANALVAEPVDPSGKLPHLCSWELRKK